MDAEPPHSRLPLWHWLLLFLPAVEMMVLSAMACPLVRYLNPDHQHRNIPHQYEVGCGMNLLMANFPVAVLACFILGYWMAGHHLKRSGGQDRRLGFLYGLGLTICNFGVALAGCALFSVL